MDAVYTTPAQRGHEIQIAFLLGLKVAAPDQGRGVFLFPVDGAALFHGA